MHKSSDTTPPATGRHAVLKTPTVSGTKQSGVGKPTRRSAAAIPVDSQTRRLMIAEAAYFRAERRGFCGEGEFEDWLEAEREIDRMLRH